METEFEEKLFDRHAKFNILYYALVYMHMQNVEDCTCAYIYSETIKQDIDNLIDEI